MLDTHNHILPGLDDGAASWEQSLAMARLAAEDGIEGVVCTPHWVLGRYDNTRPLIMKAVEDLRGMLAEHHVPLKVYPGAEMRVDASIHQKLREGELISLNDNGRYLLLELPQELLPQNLEEFFWDLRVQDITPIISHPERNPLLSRDLARLYHWAQMGVLMQLTAASLVGRFGKEAQKNSALLLRHNLVHMLVTDAHGLKVRDPRLSLAGKVVERMKGRNMMHKMTYETPKRIIRGEPVEVDEPVPIPARTSGLGRWKGFFSFLSILLALSLLISGCISSEVAAIREIHPGERPPGPLGGEKQQDSRAAVQKIEIGDDLKVTERRLVKLQLRELTTREYIEEKFRGKKVIFPEDLPREAERPTYKIGPEDELHVFVWQNPDLSLNVVVRSDGKISLPLVGELDVAGLQIPELERLLRREYARYVENPNVTVTVRAANSLKVFITGAVQISTFTAGSLPTGFPLRGDKRLLTALSQVDILENADLAEAFIVRGEAIIPLDLNRLLKDGDMTQNVLLKPSDTIVIPPRIKEITILGEVKSPGRHKVNRRTTILEALAVAGGVNRETAVLDMAYVARKGRILPVNFKRLIDAGDMGQDILLEDKDVLYVPSSKQSKVLVMGEVGRPGVVHFVDRMDLMEAISQAGDFRTTANRRQVVVVRGGIHQPRVYAVDALKMMQGRTHERFILGQYDIVYVPRTLIADWNVFLSQLLPSVTFANAVKDLVD